MPASESPAKKPRKIKPDGADGHRGRMFDKFLAAGDNDVLPRDIIEMLLYFSIRVRDTRDTAVHLMEKFDNSTDKLLAASQDELTSLDGVGGASAMLLGIVGSTVKRLCAEPNDMRKTYKTIADIRELFYPLREELRGNITCAACFDSAMRPITAVKLKNDILTDSREDIYSLVSFAAEYHSSSIAVARISNAASDYPTAQDIAAAKHIEKVFDAVGLQLVEYFVISRDEAIQVKPLFD